MKAVQIKVQFQPRDKAILLDLWRWKFLSLRALHVLHFQNVSLARCYNRLRILARAKIIAAQNIEDLNGSFWALEKKGFELIQGNLPERKENGFKSEWPAHDAACSAVQLGIANSAMGENSSIISEQ